MKSGKLGTTPDSAALLPGCMLDLGGAPILTQSRILNPRSSILDPRSSILNPRSSILFYSFDTLIFKTTASPTVLPFSCISGCV
jgi:hypothetical protein